VALAARALGRVGLIDYVEDVSGEVTITGMSGAAYPMTGLHLDTGRDIDDLVEALTQAADRSGDDDDRSRLRRAADALGGNSREVLNGVLTAYVSSRIPS
jgi:hypothetical protein